MYPSHGSFPVKPDLIPLLREGAEKILSGELEGEDFEMFGNQIKRYNVGGATFLCEL